MTGSFLTPGLTRERGRGRPGSIFRDTMDGRLFLKRSGDGNTGRVEVRSGPVAGRARAQPPTTDWEAKRMKIQCASAWTSVPFFAVT